MPRHTAAVLVALILERPLCLDCLAIKAGVSVIDAGIALWQILGTLTIHRRQDRCRICGETTLTMSAERPA